MKKTFNKLVLSILAFVVIVAVLECLVAVSLDIYHLNKPKNAKVDKQRIYADPHFKKAYLPNYDTCDWAVQYYIEDSRGKKAKYKSFIGFKLNPFEGETVNIDSNGFRATVYQASVNDTMPKAVFLGGSTMYGAGSADRYTIPSYFSLKQNKFKSYNFGSLAYSAYQSFIHLQLEFTKGFKPDLVVTYDGVNNSPVLHGFFEHLREKQFNEKIKGVDSESKAIRFYSLPALRHLTGVISKRLKLNATLPEDVRRPAPAKAQNEAAAIELLESWLSMKKLCSALGAEFICILQPHAFVGNPDITNLLNSDYKHWHRGMQDGYQYYKDVLRLLNTERYKVLKPNFQDFTNAFDNMPNTYVDF